MYYGTLDVTKKMIGIDVNQSLLRPGEFWAIDDVSFEVQRGESLGIMGGNGSGKSTLLRVLSGIYPPNKGKVSIRGRVGALIAVGAGFHPHMTGRENIFLNGTILGMTRQEILKNLESIIDFAEIGDFIDAPVNSYSSGMYVRLGFAIAIHCNPDIVIADEVLSVGDYMFQMKCFDKIQELLKNGTSILLVSHSDIAIRSVCSRVAILHRTKMIDIGKTDDMIIKYRSLAINEMHSEEQAKTKKSKFNQKAKELTTGQIQIQSVLVHDKGGALVLRNDTQLKKIPYSRDNSIIISTEIEVLADLKDCRVTFYLRDLAKRELTYVCGASISKMNSPQMAVITKGPKKIVFKMDISNLTPGVYSIIGGVGDENFHIKIHGGIDETDNLTIEIINSAELIESDVILNRPYYVPNYSCNVETVEI